MSNKDKRIAERFIEQSQNMHFESAGSGNKERKYKIVDVDSLDELVKQIGRKKDEEDEQYSN